MPPRAESEASVSYRREIGIEVFQHWGGCEGVHQCLLCCLDLWSGSPFGWLQCGRICQGKTYLGVVLDESPIEVGESEEMLDILGGVDRFNVFECFHLLICHLDSLARDYVAEEFDLVLCPLAFVRGNT